MKKLYALILCVLLVAALGITAFAADTAKITVTPSASTVYPGDEVTVTVSVASEEAWSSIGYFPWYDSAAFTVVSGEVLNPFYTKDLAEFDAVGGNGGFTYNTSDSSTGDVFKFVIKIKDDAPVGKYDISDDANMNIACELVDAEITVACKHEYGKWTEAGDEHTKTCSKCGDVQKAAHTWDAGKVTTEPTCKDEGVLTKTCADCGATKTEAVAKTTNHTYGKWTAAGDEHAKTCSVCGDVQKAAHAWDAGKVTTEPTCKDEGVLTKTCADCGATKTEAIAKTTDHKSDKWEKVDEKTHKGTCSVCAQEVTVEHTYEEKVTKEATCKEEGEKTLTCACGEVVTEKIAKTTDHKWDEGKVTTEATTEKEGVKTYTCTVCGETKTEAVAKLPAASNSDTGDNTMMIPLMILVVLSGFGLALTVIGKKKFAR